jgi:hypothetical protein
VVSYEREGKAMFLKVTETFLEKEQLRRAKSVVTEVMKAVDYSSSIQPQLKEVIKNHIYAGFRELVGSIKIFNEGLVIEFKNLESE